MSASMFIDEEDARQPVSNGELVSVSSINMSISSVPITTVPVAAAIPISMPNSTNEFAKVCM